MASGKKVYVAQYRQAGGSRRFTIGEHGRLTPEEARAEAKELLGDTAKGLDPLRQRRADRAVPLFREVASEFMRTHVAAKRKPRTLNSYETLLRLHILPVIGALKVTEIRRAQISRMHANLQTIQGQLTVHCLSSLRFGPGPRTNMKTLHSRRARLRASGATPKRAARDI